jgi:hypothetical protein
MPTVHQFRFPRIAIAMKTTLTQIPKSARQQEMMPITFPERVRPSPAASIRPDAISRKSLLPITQAAIPNGRQMTSPMIPKARIMPPRWGASARRDGPLPTSSSPQYRHRVAAALIVSPHVGQAFVASAAADRPEEDRADLSAAADRDGPESNESSTAPNLLWAGTVTNWPHPGQFARTPALSSGVLSNLAQCGQ